MIRTVLIGLGKMGISHQAIINAHPDIDLVAVCDTSDYVLDMLSKYAKVKTYTDYKKMLVQEKPEAVFIATPSKFHADMVRDALNAGCHVFCEKPFCLDTEDGLQLAALAEQKQLVNQVGYHYRFVATFQEAKRLLDLKVLGKVHHIRAEAYGPVVLRPKGGTWRAQKSEGGGCLYDYASHAIDLVGYLFGNPQSVGGTVLNQLFSRDVEDEVYSTFYFDNGATGQLSVNWSDESFRKMYTKITAWGENGRIDVNRQEIQIYVRDATKAGDGLVEGWNMRYTTDLTQPVWYYLRGEEYSGQIDHFVQAVKSGNRRTTSTFRSAVDVDLTIDAMVRNAADKKNLTSIGAR
ncbi:Gfo/Idh/MocA family protein [Occallatibacter riparius]|uniref:Gfo/Idh/MocA family oxidoreductase n=1 Tax=Occallatibacter riparius TaxID=1002689 RepID=A0A9J7BTC7_9BACT|nr:Gfo/Idh/MocA family oxidoreductase [Occallatibacter riparius]UWZ86124.1 Gfo/Idh/MocA family oxidoreductase [Occallatibacter riparius]